MSEGWALKLQTKLSCSEGSKSPKCEVNALVEHSVGGCLGIDIRYNSSTG